MQIGKTSGGEAYSRYVDAQSRVAVWMANHASSPQISKLGLTHIPGGAADAFGTKMLYANGPGLVLENDVAVPGIVPVGGSVLHTMPLAPPARHRAFFDVAPNRIPAVLSAMSGCDPIYVADNLGLYRRDMDKVSGPKLCREFAEPAIPAPMWSNMECYDAEGNFKGRYVLDNNGVAFEAKLFKYTDSPESGYLLFAPQKSAIYVPLGCTGWFSADATFAFNSLCMGWLCTAGGVDKLPWRIIKRFGEKAGIVWAEFPDDPLLTRNNFAEAFAIATEAKRQGATMKIIRVTATDTPRPDGWWDAQECLLEDREVKKLARQFKLKIDQVWRGFPGEIDFDDERQVRKVPPFWDGNRVAVFFGPGSDDLMLEMVTPRFTPWISCGRVLAVVDEKERLLAKKIHTHGGDKVRVATFDVFKNADAFIEKVQPAADMVFIVLPHDAGKFPVQAVLELCAQAELPLGIVSRSEDAPQQVVDTVNYYVAKHLSADGVFCVKDMNSNTITNYMFSPSGVEVAPGTENEMNKGE